MFLGKCILEICRNFTGEHLCRSPVSLLHIFRTRFSKNPSGRIPLYCATEILINARNYLQFFSVLVFQCSFIIVFNLVWLIHFYFLCKWSSQLLFSSFYGLFQSVFTFFESKLLPSHSYVFLRPPDCNIFVNLTKLMFKFNFKVCFVYSSISIR